MIFQTPFCYLGNLLPMLNKTFSQCSHLWFYIRLDASRVCSTHCTEVSDVTRIQFVSHLQSCHFRIEPRSLFRFFPIFLINFRLILRVRLRALFVFQSPSQLLLAGNARNLHIVTDFLRLLCQSDEERSTLNLSVYKTPTVQHYYSVWDLLPLVSRRISFVVGIVAAKLLLHVLRNG